MTVEDVLFLSDGENVKIGQPLLKGASVKAEVVGRGRDRKIIVFKRKRRKNYRKKQGHRQGYTELQVARKNGKAHAGRAAPGHRSPGWVRQFRPGGDAR